jgi:hypothetical protein
MQNTKVCAYEIISSVEPIVDLIPLFTYGLSENFFGNWT